MEFHGICFASAVSTRSTQLGPYSGLDLTLRAVLERFQSSFRAKLEHFQSSFKAILEQFWSSLRAVLFSQVENRGRPEFHTIRVHNCTNVWTITSRVRMLTTSNQ